MKQRVAVFFICILTVVSTTALAEVQIRVATFNIENFNWSDATQRDAAIAILTRVDADVVCVQEISSAIHLSNLASAAGYSYSILADTDYALDGDLRAGVISQYPFAMTMTGTAPGLSFDPGARDLTRNFIIVEVEVPGAEHPLVVVGNHWKAGTENADEFRRSVESIRAMQATAPYDSAEIPYLVVGDMNDDILDPPDSPSYFTSAPSGLPAGFHLGNDITFPVRNGVFYALEDGTGPQHLTAIDAYQLAGSPRDATRPESGRRLDYLWRSDGMTVMGAEVYDSADDCLGLSGLPKVGSAPPCEVSGQASDHLLVFADVLIADDAGACCVGDECIEVGEADCLAQDGIFHGLAVSCGEELPACAAGACCIGGFCDDTLDEARCADLAGPFAFRGVGVACGEEDPRCGLGACCLDGACDDSVTASECLDLGGSFRGEDVPCGSEQPPCGAGACCLPLGCDDTLLEAECTDQGGAFRGIGVICGQEDPPCPGPANDMLINEVLITHDGTETMEFAEIFGQPGTPLTGLTLLAIEGEGTSSKGRVDLALSLDDCGGTPCMLDEQGYFVAGGSGIAPDIQISLGQSVFENGTQTIALVRDATVAYGDDIDADNDGVPDIDPPVGTIVDAVGIVNNDYLTEDVIYFFAPAVGPVPGGEPDGLPPGGARCPNGQDTHSPSDWIYLSYLTDGSDGGAPITPDGPNPGCGGDFDGDRTVDLYDVGRFQQCFGQDIATSPACHAADFNGDGTIGVDDWPAMSDALVGP